MLHRGIANGPSLQTSPHRGLLFSAACPHRSSASAVAAAKLALHAGKHILVEKPFTINATEAAEITDLARAKGLLVLEAMWTRFLPHMQRIRDIIAAGRIGEVRSITADHRQKLSDDPKHRLNDLALGGGALLDLGIYPISFISDILGKPDTMQAYATFRATGADAQVATIFHYASGAIATTLSSSDSAGPNRACIVGTLGRIEIDRVWYEPTSFHVYSNDNALIESFSSPRIGRGMQYQAEEAEALIAAGKTESAILSPDETVQIMQTLDTLRAQIGLKYPGEA